MTSAAGNCCSLIRVMYQCTAPSNAQAVCVHFEKGEHRLCKHNKTGYCVSKLAQSDVSGMEAQSVA